ncbi:MAG: hypothetical protein KME23_12775 [Goleter apudmare HA4340-LM2]|nr:hypothetical protein [Goleter apudmare HA4340-LM2]
MLMKIWAATVVLTSSWLISGVMASEPIKETSPAGNAVTSPGSSNAQAIIVDQAEFGVERVDSPKKVTFIPTIRVPFKEGSRYGWRIKLKEYKGEVTWREVLRLPKRPETWGTTSTENFSISPNGEEATTKRKVKTIDGVIENFWTVTPGDPAGKHRIEVYVNDRLIGAFDFEIIAIKNRI